MNTPPTKRYLLFVMAIVVSTFSLVARAEEKKKVGEGVSFSREVAPIFVKNCLACHGPKTAESSYRLDSFARLKKMGDFEEPNVTPGKPAESLLHRLVSSEDEDERMPKDGDPLTKQQIEIVRKWIEQGAKFDGPSPEANLASYIPRQQHPVAPVKYSAPMPITAVEFSSDGKELFVGGYHELTVWNSTDGKLLRRLGNIAQRTYALAMSKDGKTLAVASGTPGQSGEMKLINPADGKEIRLFGTTADVIFDVAFSPDGKLLATAASDRSIRIYDVASGKEIRVIENHADWVMAICFSPDGSKIASASRDKTAKVFDVKKGQLISTFSGHGEAVYGVAFKADGKQIYSSGRDKNIRLWNVKDGKKAADIGGFGKDVYALVNVGGSLFSCSADMSVRQHNEADRKQVRVFSGHQDWVYALAVTSSGKKLASGAFDGQIRIWNIKDGKPVVSFLAAPGFSSSK